MSTTRLLPHGARQQAKLVAAADAAAAAADQAIKRVWRQLLGVLATHGDAWEARRTVQVILRSLRRDVHNAMGRALIRAGNLGHALAAEKLSRLPLRYLKHAAARKPHRVREESDADRLRRLAADPLNWLFTDLAAPLREPGEMSEEEQRDLFLSLLFPPPSEEKILGLLNAGPEPWFSQLARATRLANPDVLAQIIGVGYAQGKSQAEIAKDLMPAVNGVRVSARRIARTEGIRIAHAMQEEAHEELGDLLIGYEIHATHGNPASRAWHLARDHTQYFKRPGPGQLGLDRMPRPPEESPDPRDRPMKAPKTAFN